MNYQTPGEILKELLDKYKISKKDFAAHLGIGIRQIIRLLNDEATMTAEKSVVIAAALGIDPQKLLHAQTRLSLQEVPTPAVGIYPDIPEKILIRKNISLPSSKSSTSRKGTSKYPLIDMEVGDSFIIPCDSSNKKILRVKQSAIIALCNQLRKSKKTDMKIATRQIPDGLGVWRIE